MNKIKSCIMAVLGVIACASPVLAAPGAPGAPAQPVTVTNTASNPVPMRDVAVSARQPYRLAIFGQIDEGQFFNQLTMNVPTGKRLVTETVSFIGSVPLGQKMIADFSVPDPGNFQLPQLYLLELKFQGSFPGSNPDAGIRNDMFVATHSIKMCPEAPFNFIVNRNINEGISQFTITVSGYLEDLP